MYLARFKQYLSRALNLVKQHVVYTLKTTTKAVLPKLDKPVSLLVYTYIVPLRSALASSPGIIVHYSYYNVHVYQILYELISSHVSVCQGTPTTSDPTPENSYAQYYGKFRTSAPKIKVIHCNPVRH